MIHKKHFLLSIIVITSIHIFIFAQTNIKEIQAINIQKEQPIKISFGKFVVKKEIIKKKPIKKKQKKIRNKIIKKQLTKKKINKRKTITQINKQIYIKRNYQKKYFN